MLLDEAELLDEQPLFEYEATLSVHVFDTNRFPRKAL